VIKFYSLNARHSLTLHPTLTVLGLCTPPFGASRVICGAHLRLRRRSHGCFRNWWRVYDKTYEKRLLWGIDGNIAREPCPCNLPSTPNMRQGRPQVSFLKSGY